MGFVEVPGIPRSGDGRRLASGWAGSGSIGAMQRNMFGSWIGIWFLLGLTLAGRAADLPLVAAWDFNTPGVLRASQGSGEARILGGVSATHLTGSPADPVSPNASLGLRGFPPQGMATRSAGIEFVLEEAFSSLQLALDVRVSPAACSRLAVLVGQGGDDPVEAGTLEVGQDGVFIPLSLDLSGVLHPVRPGPTRIRIVADVGPDGVYPTVKPRPDGTNPYSPSGMWRLDRVSFRGVAREDGGEVLRLAVSDASQGLGLEWSHPRLEQFTLWRAPSPEGPWSPLGVLYESRTTGPIDSAMGFYRVTSP